jgi:hypothetical protein
MSSSKNHNSQSIDRLRSLSEPLEPEIVFFHFGIRPLVGFPLIAIPVLLFLTANRSQVRFDVDTKSLAKVFLVDSMIATYHVVSVA